MRKLNTRQDDYDYTTEWFLGSRVEGVAERWSDRVRSYCAASSVEWWWGGKEGFYGYEKTPVRSDSYSLRFSLRRRPRGTHIISSSVISRHRLAVLRSCSCVYVRYCVYYG